MGKYSGKACRLLTMLGMTASLFLVEIIVGYVTNSIALVADSFHMLSDVVALTVGFASVRISKWRTQKNTFGWVRAEVLGALVNSVFLIALCFSIFVEALKRLVEVERINNPQLLLIVGGAGLLINLIGLALFHNHGHSHGVGGGHGHSHGGHSHDDNKEEHNESVSLVDKTVNGGPDAENRYSIKSGSEQDPNEIIIEFDENKMSSSSQLNMRAVFLHVLGDALGSVIVIISAITIWLIDANWVYYLDPAMSIVMVIIILSTTIPLLKESALILLQTVPTHIRVKDIREKIEKIDGVQNVHELHVWQLAGKCVVASAHIRVSNLQKYILLSEKIKNLFHNEGIHSTTIQPEFSKEDGICSSRDCLLACGPDCYHNTCCAQPKKPSPTKTDTSNPRPNGTHVSNGRKTPTKTDTSNPRPNGTHVSNGRKTPAEVV